MSKNELNIYTITGEEELDAVLGVSLDDIENADRLTLPSFYNYYIGNTKAQNTTLAKKFSDLVNTTLEIDVTKKHSSEFLVYMNFFSDNVILPENYDYTLQDDLLLNTIGNLYDKLNQNGTSKLISVRMITNFMDGKPLTSSVRQSRILETVEHLDRLSNVKVTIDATGHANYNAQNQKKRQFEEFLFSGRMIDINFYSIDGVMYARLLSTPPLYQYAKNSGQIIKFKYDNLDLTKMTTRNELGEVVRIENTTIKSMTAQRRSIRDYVFKRIGQNETIRAKEIFINYDTILQFLAADLDLNIKNRSSRQTIKNNIEAVLDALKQKSIIKDYSFSTKGHGGSYHSIKLLLK